jgi:DNA repair exonuclease SbcCD ATPase subunit
MKKAIAVVLVFLAIAPAPALAEWPVFDMNAAKQHIEQLKEAQKQLAELQKQVETLGGIKTEAEQARRAVMGNYNRAMSMVRDLQRIQKKLESTPTTIQGYAKKWFSLGQDGLEIGEDGFVAVGKILDTQWVDPRDIKNHVEKLKRLDQVFQVKQASLRGNIEASDEILRAMPERMKNLEDLTKQIDETENIKDAQDLTNRFLAEILKALAELTMVGARMQESYALMNYQGASDSTMQQRIQTQSNESREGWAARDLRKEGYDPKNMTRSDQRKIMNAGE